MKKELVANANNKMQNDSEESEDATEPEERHVIAFR